MAQEERGIASGQGEAHGLRLSPEDGKIYSFEEFRGSCACAYDEEEIRLYWDAECQPLEEHAIGRFVLRTLGLASGEEARTDPEDGALRTRQELRQRWRQRAGACAAEEAEPEEDDEFRRYWEACERWWRGPGSHRCSGPSWDAVVCNLCLSGLVRSAEVLEGLLGMDRWYFVPDKDEAYTDVPQLLGPHATISAPHMHAQCLQLLASHLRPGATVLDVGCGSGYLAAAMAEMVTRDGARGFCVGIDHLDYLVELSASNVRTAKGELLDDRRVEFHRGDGWQGWAEGAPYDVIHVGAAAPVVPEELKAQLKVGGRLVIPVGRIFPDVQQQLVQVDRLPDGTFQEKEVCGVRYVPLVQVSQLQAPPLEYEGVS